MYRGTLYFSRSQRLPSKCNIIPNGKKQNVLCGAPWGLLYFLQIYCIFGSVAVFQDTNAWGSSFATKTSLKFTKVIDKPFIQKEAELLWSLTLSHKYDKRITPSPDTARRNYKVIPPVHGHTWQALLEKKNPKKDEALFKFPKQVSSWQFPPAEPMVPSPGLSLMQMPLNRQTNLLAISCWWPILSDPVWSTLVAVSLVQAFESCDIARGSHVGQESSIRWR